MEPPSKRSIVVINESGVRCRHSVLARAVQTACQEHSLSGSVNVLLTTNEHIAQLNQDFRGISDPTDVLTFAAEPFPGEELTQLGDIAISVQVAASQAKSRKVSLSQELGFLALHGALHLVGYDDETETDRRKMLAEMNRIAPLCGLKTDFDWYSRHYSEATA